MLLYASDKTYKIGDRVYYGNYVYDAKQETTGNLPTDKTYWTMKWMFVSDLMIKSYQNRVNIWYREKKEKQEKDDEELALLVSKAFMQIMS